MIVVFQLTEQNAIINKKDIQDILHKILLSANVYCYTSFNLDYYYFWV